MFWPFATSMEELMMFTGRRNYLNKYSDQSEGYSQDLSEHTNESQKNGTPFPE